MDHANPFALTGRAHPLAGMRGTAEVSGAKREVGGSNQGVAVV